ncbi:hypothetical protein CTI12_AA265100 [Artemisia annua]|uniref:Uncharacterized protein n=1 Tax=Artemisia annua TaxID=35608 RepID=A0A2U1NC94_ARTAN|nr:hypothetical protein CTI12_AA265100 [Artemisia annua]
METDGACYFLVEAVQEDDLCGVKEDGDDEERVYGMFTGTVFTMVNDDTRNSPSIFFYYSLKSLEMTCVIFSYWFIRVKDAADFYLEINEFDMKEDSDDSFGDIKEMSLCPSILAVKSEHSSIIKKEENKWKLGGMKNADHESVRDSVDKGWQVVIKPSPRHVYDMDEQTSLDDVETHLQGDSFMGRQHDETMEIELVRGGFDETVVDNNDLVIADEEDPVEAA